LIFVDIKFIGELFKADMLTEKIMNSCIMKLLGEVKNPSEEDILLPFHLSLLHHLPSNFFY